MNKTTEVGRGLDLRSGGEEDHWISMSDLMAGLMMVFLFIAVALMRVAFQERDIIEGIAIAYQENQVAIYKALVEEFGDDLPDWQAEIHKDTLSIEFNAPEVFFATGSTNIEPEFMIILDDFFPRYINALLTKHFRDSINEVRIEGHTSSVWEGALSLTDAYFKNMRLSQGRTRAVLEYVYKLKTISSSDRDRTWVKKRVAAVGLSSSQVVMNDDGTENRDRSRRVTFRVITNAETQIHKILEKLAI